MERGNSGRDDPQYGVLLAYPAATLDKSQARLTVKQRQIQFLHRSALTRKEFRPQEHYR